MIESLLIANRGEIACRIIRSARRLGIQTIAIYSEADRGALHTELADQAHCIGPAPARESYLQGERIAELAARLGVQAIHPGYGFLSEDANFAEACQAAGIVFVGPPAAAIRSMGRKDEAKARMRDAGVPVVPGLEGELDGAALGSIAGEIGFPVLVKAVAGGGGRGMRRVDEPSQLEAAIAAARREAKAAFGDERLLIEKLIECPRHIEIQVFADGAGHCVHLFERDCSLQRRHQKVVEESPAPGMPDELRQAMCRAAVQAATAIGYVGAGTVEFVVDATVPLDKAPFYFIEMNTRLQVEHPVTELVTGLDLVEWQLRVAGGEPLPLEQSQIELSGHAIEMRLYCEDPSKGYLPSTGDLAILHFPDPQPGLGVETGAREGDAVTVHYDGMLAKLAVHGRDRDQACQRMSAALRQLRVAGVATNASLLASVCAHPEFRAGRVDTGFLERHRADLVPGRTPAPARVLALAALALAGERREAKSPWDVGDAFRLNLPASETLVLKEDGRRVVLAITHQPDGALRVRAPQPDGSECEFLLRASRVDSWLLAEVDGRHEKLRLAHSDDGIWLAVEGASYCLAVEDPAGSASAAAAGGGQIRAPMPGRVTEVLVEVGSRVRRGEALARMEAMKMEHVFVAAMDGTVSAVHVDAGAQVDDGDVLVEIEDPSGLRGLPQ